MDQNVFHIAGCVLPGAGAFEIAAYQELMKFKDKVKGRARLGRFRVTEIKGFEVDT